MTRILDRLPIAFGTVLCAALTVLWLQAPVVADRVVLPDFAVDFARALQRQRLVVFPLGVATSIAALVVVLRHGALLTRRGALQVGASLVLFASGMVSALATEPTAKHILAALGSGPASDLPLLLSRFGQYSGAHVALAFLSLACLVLAERQPLPSETDGRVGSSPGSSPSGSDGAASDASPSSRWPARCGSTIRAVGSRRLSRRSSSRKRPAWWR